MARRDLPSGTAHYYFSDHLKSVSLVTSASGTIEDESDYTPWGEERRITSTLADQHFKFNGKERDPETGFDEFGARLYSSAWSRWLIPDWSADPTPVPYGQMDNPQSLNLYAYALSNPTTLPDFDGHLTPLGGSGSSGDGGQSAQETPEKKREEEQLAEQTKGAKTPTKGGKTPSNQPADPEPKNPDGSRKPPPIPVPGCPKCGWVWSDDPNNTRGGRWVPDENYPAGNPGGRPGASWDPGSRGGPGHWDVDDGTGRKNGGRQRYYPDGRPMPDDVAHPPGWKPVWTRNIMIGVGAVGTGYLIYRGVRMLPSVLIPPLWPTIPVNAAIP